MGAGGRVLRMASLRRLLMSGRWMEAKLRSGLADGILQWALRFLLSVASALKRARAAASLEDLIRIMLQTHNTRPRSP